VCLFAFGGAGTTPHPSTAQGSTRAYY
jgi:hypothetical protein